jgi:hypothetical protein
VCCVAARIIEQENTNRQLHVFDKPPTNVKDFLKLCKVKDKKDNTEDSDMEDNDVFEDYNPLMFLAKNLFGGQAH